MSISLGGSIHIGTSKIALLISIIFFYHGSSFHAGIVRLGRLVKRQRRSVADYICQVKLEALVLGHEFAHYSLVDDCR